MPAPLERVQRETGDIARALRNNSATDYATLLYATLTTVLIDYLDKSLDMEDHVRDMLKFVMQSLSCHTNDKPWKAKNVIASISTALNKSLQQVTPATRHT